MQKDARKSHQLTESKVSLAEIPEDYGMKQNDLVISDNHETQEVKLIGNQAEVLELFI